MGIITFICVIATFVFYGWVGCKVATGIQNGNISSEGIGKEVGKFLKGVDEGKK